MLLYDIHSTTVLISVAWLGFFLRREQKKKSPKLRVNVYFFFITCKNTILYLSSRWKTIINYIRRTHETIMIKILKTYAPLASPLYYNIKKKKKKL